MHLCAKFHACMIKCTHLSPFCWTRGFSLLNIFWPHVTWRPFSFVISICCILDNRKCPKLHFKKKVLTAEFIIIINYCSNNLMYCILYIWCIPLGEKNWLHLTWRKWPNSVVQQSCRSCFFLVKIEVVGLFTLWLVFARNLLGFCCTCISNKRKCLKLTF